MMTETPKKKHNHGEAFMLMTYACNCGHREIIWNSRDGVTPFGLGCPSCGKSNLHHIEWRRDVYAPAHKLHRGQRFWRDGTPDEAEAIMRRRLKSAEGTQWAVTPEHAAELIRMAREGNDEFQQGWPMIDCEGSTLTTETKLKPCRYCGRIHPPLHVSVTGICARRDVGEEIERHRLQALASLSGSKGGVGIPDGWKLVPPDLSAEMKQAWFDELARWGTRYNKGQERPHEVFRHAREDVVSPVVVEAFKTEHEAERCRLRLETDAAYRAMLSASPPTHDEQGVRVGRVRQDGSGED